MEHFKVTIVGDCQTGKTCLSIAFHDNKFPSQYIPSVYNAFTKDMTVHNKVCHVAVYEDVSDDGDHDRPRRLNYPGTDTIIALFSVDSRESFENIENRWILEVRADLPLTPILIVANKTDMRELSECKTVSYAEGFGMAKEVGTSYREVSCREQHGIQECLEHAIELAILNSPKVKEQLNASSVIIPPFLPPPDPEPVFGTQEYDRPSSSTYASDWLPFIANPKYHDVRFILEGEKNVFSHKIFLCSASSFFRKVFLTSVPSKSNVDAVHSFGVEELNSGLVPGIQRIYDSEEDEEVTVELSADIKADMFNSLLTFIYSGSLSQKSEDIDLSDLLHIAQIFDIPRLVSHCDKLLAAPDSENNSSLAENSDDQKGPTISEFWKQDLFSDLVFNVQGTKIPAHKVVVCARSKKLMKRVDKMCHVYQGIGMPAYKMVQRVKKPWEKPMTDPREEEEDNRVEIPIAGYSAEVFTAFLQYLYTDHVDFDDSIDTCALAVLSNKNYVFRLARISEFPMKIEVDCLLKNLGKGEALNIFELFEKFEKSCSFDMLYWCVHYTGVNYDKFEERIESYNDLFHFLDKARLQRWPPVHYINEVVEFEKKLMKADLLTSWKKRQMPKPLCTRFKLCANIREIHGDREREGMIDKGK